VPGHKKIKLQNGYVHLYRPWHPMTMRNGMVLEHRMVAYDAGWVIPEGHHLHHKNGVKHDNRIENLEIIAIDEHSRLHARIAGKITNQFGTFDVVHDPERRKERQRAHNLKQKQRRLEALCTGAEVLTID
jgi:hypothetical protein